MSFAPPADAETVTSYRRVATRLRLEILSGEAAPGSWLRMQAVALRYGVSVQPVRDALQVLEGEGLVQIHPNRGAQVRGLDRARVVHMYEVREALESFMSRRFAEEASLMDIRQLEDIQRRHEAAGDDLDAVILVNAEFHRVIYTHGGNQDVIELVTRYIDLGSMLTSRYRHPAGYLARARREHHALIDAFHRRDASAAADIGAQHVRATRASILAGMDKAVAIT
jgi:DNA-binding GntR family transcriptional regulator